jgi:large subunit ribosomal protein L6
MSRIGNMPLQVPDKVKLNVNGRLVLVEGPQGKLQFQLPRRTSIKVDGATVRVGRDGDDSEAKAMHGLGRAIINNMLQGVSVGFSKKLEIHGVGFKAVIQGTKIVLSLGYSHPLSYDIPPQIKVTVEENTKLTIAGPDKELVGKVASEIRAYYPPEPYKGKGVRYSDEKILKKEGKTVQ